MEPLASIPAGRFPIVARAPGKCILFGEHSVVHGGPELLFAIDLYTQVSVRPAAELRLNGDRDPRAHHPYLGPALDRFGPVPPLLEIRSTSALPRAAGLGSSAAFVSALTAALASARGGLSREALAAESFAIERQAQGVGSPGDTSASVAGGWLSLNAPAPEPLWSVSDGERSWPVGRLPDPGWGWVIGYSGVPRSTGLAVQAVGRRLAEPDGPGLLERFRDVALRGLDALRAEDPTEVGRLMTENQALLATVGVSHPRLDALLEAVAPASYGAKLTGAGAGGSIVALPRPGKALEAVRRLTRVGAAAYAVKVAPVGASLLESQLPREPPGDSLASP
ncbi:MAG TPA: galactokinase family protein [Thermoplasmata archaeon]|nr:galactokinase family protein [Thermoplasmata archaeon]